MTTHIVCQGGLLTLVMMVMARIRMAGAIGWMCELHGAKQVQGPVRGRRGYPDGGGDHGGRLFLGVKIERKEVSYLTLELLFLV
jgi:hypothetical protein